MGFSKKKVNVWTKEPGITNIGEYALLLSIILNLFKNPYNIYPKVDQIFLKGVKQVTPNYQPCISISCASLLVFFVILSPCGARVIGYRQSKGDIG